MQKNEIKLVEERGYIIDYGSLWCGRLDADKEKQVCGFRVFRKDGYFDGLLSEDKTAEWFIDKTTLSLDRSEEIPIEKEGDEYERLIFMYEKRYCDFLASSLDGLGGYSLKDCPKIVAEAHTLWGMQQMYPTIIFTEGKLRQIMEVWMNCDYRKVFANCCSSPIVNCIEEDAHNVLNACRKIIYEDVPWASSLFEESENG